MELDLERREAVSTRPSRFLKSPSALTAQLRAGHLGSHRPGSGERRAGKAKDADKKLMTAPEGKRKGKNPPKEAQEERLRQVAPLQFN